MFGIFKKGKKDQAPAPDHKLTDITRGMYHAAATTNAMLAENFLYLLKQYFTIENDNEGNEVYTPITKPIAITEDSTIELPLISLVSPKNFILDKMHVDFSIKVDDSNLKGIFDQIDNELNQNNLTRSSFSVQISPSSDPNSKRRPSDIIDIHMEFKASDPPEGIMRMIDQYTKMVAPPTIYRNKQDQTEIERGSIDKEKNTDQENKDINHNTGKDRDDRDKNKSMNDSHPE